MSIIDIVLFIVLLWAGWKGFSRGLVIEIASLVALILGIYAAINFSGYAAGIIQEYVEMEARMLRILSFALTFIVVVLGVILIGKILERLVNLVMLGFLNKISGALFSMLKAAVVLSVLMMLMNMIDTNGTFLSEKKREASLLYQPVESIVPALIDLMQFEKNPLEMDKKDFIEINI